MTEKTPTVADRSAVIRAMQDDWEMADALMGGTKAMRAASTKFLPRWPNEESTEYQFRLNNSTLFPSYARTAVVLAGKPLSHPLVLSEESDDQAKEWMANVDRQGRDLHSFMVDVIARVMGWGVCYVVVDFPPNTTDGTVEGEKAAGLRPYAAIVSHSRVLGWLEEGGTMTQFRYEEEVEEPHGEFGTKPVKQIRVLEQNQYRVFRKSTTPGANQDEWVETERGPLTLGRVPVVVFVAEQTGPFIGRLPLNHLAHLNLKHWRSQSDQDNILHVTRVPILQAIGVQDDFKMTVGAAYAVKITEPQSRGLAWVEHSGAAIGAGKVSLDDLKDEMRQAGAELLMPRPGMTTATEARIDASGGLSDMQRITLRLQDSLAVMLDMFRAWGKLQGKLEAKLFTDFNSFALGDNSAATVLQAQAQGLISRETAIEELKRRAVLSADIDTEEELEKAAAEAPDLEGVPPDGSPPQKKPAPQKPTKPQE